MGRKSTRFRRVSNPLGQVRESFLEEVILKLRTNKERMELGRDGRRKYSWQRKWYGWGHRGGMGFPSSRNSKKPRMAGIQQTRIENDKRRGWRRANPQKARGLFISAFPSTWYTGDLWEVCGKKSIMIRVTSLHNAFLTLGGEGKVSQLMT